MGDAHFAALEWYRRHGLQAHCGNEPADHAAYLLMLYGRLLEDGVDEAVLPRFCQEQLAWIGLLAAKIRSETRRDFYRVLADLIKCSGGCRDRLREWRATAGRRKSPAGRRLAETLGWGRIGTARSSPNRQPSSAGHKLLSPQD